MSSSFRSGYLYAAACVLIWSGFVLLSRVAGTSALNGFDMTALRFGTAAVLLLPLWLFWKRVPLFNLRMAVLVATGGIGYSVVAYSSFHSAPAAHGAVLLSGILPFFVAVLAWRLLDQPLSPNLKSALLVIAFGVSALAMHSLHDLATSWPGDLMMITASLLWGLYTVLVKKWGYSPWETTLGVALLSALIYLPIYALLLPKGITLVPLSAIIMQAFYQGFLVVIVAMMLYMQALARLGPTQLGAAMATVPAVAGIGATLALGEPFTAWLLAGLILTSLGAWMSTR
ncbi:MAG: DMT family transporter [Moraxellaceae bacterium]|jgi:drug/metabolite transporter (DMT)-like permease|nr:DMT family transporter [Moraxellaceae bacterium]MBP8852654.1 DMT family transporter [Moraxellaceae bacterium]MBP9731638.1 DMT family transporter [Moraxellaceae bacterium]MCC6200541.1 DMT family transporter [Moraxellaceae bacterium]HQV41756.1 DMT family transporter [Moraxellaceae bacterium]